jgi:mannose-6-phosphate isomerase
VPKIIRLRPDNFTPPARTPWGGQRILNHYKAGLALAPEKKAYPVVGESWEFSVDPSFPSLEADAPHRPIQRIIEDEPLPFLGASCLAKYGPSTPILVKLLDAAEALSVQVHPRNDDPRLAANESGKPEAWLILEAQKGAGIYLGLAHGVSQAQLADALATEAELTPMLNFVHVKAGDAFVIEPGVVHAIGAGVTLLEPQLCYPGKSGKTYRFWDWGRRFDAAGQLDPKGELRPLHVEESLAVCRYDGPRGDDFVRSVRFEAQRLEERTGARLRRLLQVEDLELLMLDGNGQYTLPTEDQMLLALVLNGKAKLGEQFLRRGEAAVVSAASQQVEIRLEYAELAICKLHSRAPSAHHG